MPDNIQMTVYEISGDQIVGGETAEQNQRFHEHLNQVQMSALKIGRALGMTEVSFGAVQSPLHTFGFRFATSSADRFEVRGIEAHDSVPAAQIINRLK